MELGAILFIGAVLYFVFVDTSWRDKPVRVRHDDRIDVLKGGDGDEG